MTWSGPNGTGLNARHAKKRQEPIRSSVKCLLVYVGFNCYRSVACQRDAHIPQLSGPPDFLLAYAACRCRDERHNVAYSLLFPIISTCVFLTDILVLAPMAYSSISRGDILCMWPIVHFISSNFRYLNAVWLWKIRPISWESTHSMGCCTNEPTGTFHPTNVRSSTTSVRHSIDFAPTNEAWLL